jgi:hypothetical protein
MLTVRGGALREARLPFLPLCSGWAAEEGKAANRTSIMWNAMKYNEKNITRLCKMTIDFSKSWFKIKAKLRSFPTEQSPKANCGSVRKPVKV